jgi:hypothetical protein
MESFHVENKQRWDTEEVFCNDVSRIQVAQGKV